MYSTFGSSLEVEVGLTELFVSMAFSGEPAHSFTVITRNSGLWSSKYSNHNITILDLSPVLPPLAPDEFKIGEAQLKAEVKRNILQAGWTEGQITFEHKSKVHSRETADFSLVDTGGKCIAIIEVKRSRALLGQPMEQAIKIAGLAQARYALVTNGREVLVYDSQGDVAINHHSFPSPRELTLDAPPIDIHKLAAEASPMTTIPVLDFAELIQQMEGAPHNTLIVDHTMPWGTRVPDALAGCFLKKLQKPLHMDMPEALLGLASNIRPGGVIVGLVLPRTCFSKGSEGVRSSLTEHFCVSAIVELPADIFRPVASIRSTAIRLVAPAPKRDGRTFLYPVSSRGELIDPVSQAWFKDFKDGLQGKNCERGFFATVGKNDPWTISSHRRVVTGAVSQVGKYADTVLLGTVCDIYAGWKHSRNEAARGRGIPVVRGRDIGAGVNTINDLTCYETVSGPSSKPKISAGDVLIQKIGSSPKATLATSGLEGAYASDTVFIIRPKGQEPDSSLICEFLNSFAGQSLLSARVRGVYVPTLTIADLRLIPIPILSESITSDLQELSGLEESLRMQADRLRAMRLDVFSATSQADFEARIIEMRQISKITAASVKQAESLDFQIRNFYPYPVAFRYRTLTSYTVPSDLYREQLECAENILAFLGSLSLALLKDEDRDRANIPLERYCRGGLSPGHWCEVSRHTSNIFKAYEDNGLAQSLFRLWHRKGKKGFQANVDKVVAAINDFKHRGEPHTDEDFEEGTKVLESILIACLKDMPFLAEYPIRLIREMSGIRNSPLVAVKALQCSGDHPGLKQEELTYPLPVQKNDLYVEISTNDWRPLFPFLVARNCPRCKTREFYFVDKWQGKGNAAVCKSFEKWHTEEDSEVGAALEKW